MVIQLTSLSSVVRRWALAGCLTVFGLALAAQPQLAVPSLSDLDNDRMLIAGLKSSVNRQQQDEAKRQDAASLRVANEKADDLKRQVAEWKGHNYNFVICKSPRDHSEVDGDSRCTDAEAAGKNWHLASDGWGWSPVAESEVKVIGAEHDILQLIPNAFGGAFCIQATDYAIGQTDFWFSWYNCDRKGEREHPWAISRLILNANWHGNPAVELVQCMQKEDALAKNKDCSDKHWELLVRR